MGTLKQNNWLAYYVSPRTPCPNEENKTKLQQCYNRDWFKTAPMYIIASILHDEEWVRADGKPHGNIDIAIAVEHLCLAATEQGLATCWVCNFDANLCKEQSLAYQRMRSQLSSFLWAMLQTR